MDEVLHQEVQDLVRLLRARRKVAVPDVIASLLRVADAGEPDLVAELAAAASARHPGRVRLLLACATALEKTGQHAAAVVHLREALNHDADNGRRTALRLARALVASGATVAEVDDAYARVVREGPDGALALNEWREAERSADDVPFLDRLSDLQGSTDSPLPVVLHELLRGPTADVARQEHAEVIAVFLAGDDARACAGVWAAYAALEPLPEADADRVAELSTPVKRLFFLAAPPRTMTLDEAAAGAGLDPGAVAWWRDEFLSPDLPQPDDREFVTEAQRGIAAADDPHLAHQSRAVRDRRLVLRDLVTGSECAPFDAFVSFGKAVYSYGEDEHAMLLSLGAGFKASFVYLPARDLLIDLGAVFGRPILSPHKRVGLFSDLLTRVVAQRDRYAAAVASRPEPGAERTVVLQMTVAENFAHHVWNFHPGVERLIEHGLAGNVDEVRTAGTQFFGPFQELFPELSDARIVDEPRRGIRDPYPFSHEHLVISLGGYFIRRSLVGRIRERAAQAEPTPGFAQPPSAGAPAVGPVVWIGLRARSRAWANQGHEVARFADALHLRYPHALVVLDGYSYPMGNDLISERWQGTIDELHAVARAIKANARRGDQVIDLVGSSLREAVLWAQATDVYVAPNGTSQHKVGWFSDAPGVVYAPRSLGAVPRELRPGARESEGRPVPVTYFGEPVGEGERRGRDDVRPHLENLRIDRGQLLAKVCDLLDARAAASPSRSRQESLYRRAEKLVVTRLAPRLNRRANVSSSST